MELATFFATLRRRWGLTLDGVLLAAAATAFILYSIGPDYEAEGTVLLFPPVTTTVQGGQEVKENPYLSLGGLDPARDVLIRAMTAEAQRDEVDRRYPGAEYEMESDIDVSGPVVQLTVTGRSSAQALEVLDLLLEEVPPTLTSLQGELGIRDADYITSRTLVSDERADIDRRGQIRAGIVVGAGLLTGSLLLVGLVDGLQTRRRRVEPASAPTGAAGPSPEPPTSAPASTASAASVTERDSEPTPRPGQPSPTRLLNGVASAQKKATATSGDATEQKSAAGSSAVQRNGAAHPGSVGDPSTSGTKARTRGSTKGSTKGSDSKKQRGSRPARRGR